MTSKIDLKGCFCPIFFFNLSLSLHSFNSAKAHTFDVGIKHSCNYYITSLAIKEQNTAIHFQICLAT